MREPKTDSKYMTTTSEPPYTDTELFINLDCFDDEALEAAYEACRQITKVGSKGFYFSTLFLPYEKRRAIWAVYTFCRYTDDLVDKAPNMTERQLSEELDNWESELHKTYEKTTPPSLSHMLAWKHATSTFKIPKHPPLELIEGVRMDLGKNRYDNFDELRLYCYRVASTVGLMASHVIGFSQPCALDYAVELGVAMQLTNILRDVGEDARSGRIYIPLDEMAQFGYTEEELLRGEVNERFVRLMQFQIDRARQLYQQAVPGIEYLDKDSRLSISVAAHLYSRILSVIERNDYDVFNRRAFVPFREKLSALAKVWYKRKFGAKTTPN